MKVVIKNPVCPLYSRPDRRSERTDEALHGMEAELVGSPGPGWYRIRTEYGYEGYVSGENLALDPQTADYWRERSKRRVFCPAFCDVLTKPAVQSSVLAALPRGAVIAAEEEPADGWQRVALCDGRKGYTRCSFLDQYYAAPPPMEETALRQKLVSTARLYTGTAYRWGGKTPVGIDCSGFVSIVFLLWGIVVWRDAGLRAGFAAHSVDPREKKAADLLYWPGHIALYLGENRYLHATGRAGDDCVCEGSLDAGSSRFRPDLGEPTVVGSVFPLSI